MNITGVFVSSGSGYFKNGTNIYDCTLSGNNLVFETGITVTDSYIANGTIKGGEFTNVTINSASFYGGYYGDSVWNSGKIYKIEKEGN